MLQVSTQSLFDGSAYFGKGHDSVQFPESGSPKAFVHVATHLLCPESVCLKYPLGHSVTHNCNPSYYQPVGQVSVHVAFVVEFYIW